ncbi:hypothetical protein ACFQ10_10350 [Streptomyces indonesiensis]
MIDAAPGPATPLEAFRAALDALTATFTDDRRDVGARLRPVIAGNTELQERSALKRAKLAEAVTDALHKRGVSEPTASLAAELGIRAFCDAFDQWADPAGKQTLTELTRHTLDELRAALVALGWSSSTRTCPPGLVHQGSSTRTSGGGGVGRAPGVGVDQGERGLGLFDLGQMAELGG